MPDISVSQAVLDCLQRHAQTTDETPNAILERLLGVQEPQASAIASGESGPQPSSAYREPILRVLRQSGGRAPKREVLARIPQILTLTEADLQRNAKGQPRWERQVAAAARAMRVEGILVYTHYGIWTLATRD